MSLGISGFVTTISRVVNNCKYVQQWTSISANVGMGHQNSSRPMGQQLWIYENSFYKNLAGWVGKVISMLDEFFTEKDMKQRSHQ